MTREEWDKLTPDAQFEFVLSALRSIKLHESMPGFQEQIEKAKMRGAFGLIYEDWDDPSMDVYDDM